MLSGLANFWQRGSIGLMISVSVTLSGCQQAPSQEEIDTLATAYADVLFVQQLTREDSSAIRASVDSVLKRYGYVDKAKFSTRLKEVGHNPEVMRKIFDSTQHRLQQVSNQDIVQ